MYKILIKYNESHGLWKSYGTETITTSTTGASTTSYTEFETDDIDVLKAELLKLDAQFGHNNIMVCEVVDTDYSVTVGTDEEIVVPDDTDTPVVDENASDTN